ncbi:MAG: hypothetical protein J0H98_09400 [Solirubrobacterales bacterium]|nr:hypothetical protein [Solirubrobacterales bacterium]
MKKYRAPLLITFILLVGAVQLGCGGSDDGAAKSNQAVNPQTGSSVDYDPVSGPAELSKLPGTNLVVAGIAQKPQKGRVWADGPDDKYGALTTTVVPIAVEVVEQGSLPDNSDGMVYMEIQLAPGTEPEFDSIDGRKGIFYLNRLPDDLGPSNGIYPIDAENGRPKGQPMFQASHPQGVLIEGAEGGVWSVESAEGYPEATLEDFLPSEGEFPPRSAAPAS